MSGGETGLAVLIAAHDQHEPLRRCLDSLVAQTQDPVDFEVIVADCGSSDGSPEVLEALKTPFELRVLKLERSGRVDALNAALGATTAPACLILNADAIAAQGLIAAHLAAHREHESTLAMGPMRGGVPLGATFSAPRKALAAVGGFPADPPAKGDLGLFQSLCEHGCAPSYLPIGRDERDPEAAHRPALGEARGFGGACAEFSAAYPPARPMLLGWFDDSTNREVVLRRLVLSLRLPPAALSALGRLIPGRASRALWSDFVCRYAFWLGARERMEKAEWARTTHGVPVLMYHAFGERDENNRYVMSKRSFRWQMRLLAALRFRVIPLERLIRGLRENDLPPKRAVVITIDDGYLDNLTLAWPILRRYRFPATFFLVSRKLGANSDWQKADNTTLGRPLLSIKQARDMHEAGASVGAHTRTHCSLPNQTDEELDDQIQGSRKDLEETCGAPVETFAYPFGRFDRRAVEAVEQAGYAGACTADADLVHTGADPLRIPRIEVKSTDALPRFLYKLLAGGG